MSAVTAACVIGALAWLQWRWDIDREAIAHIRSIGGIVEVGQTSPSFLIPLLGADYARLFDRARAVCITHTQLKAEDFRQLAMLAVLEELTIMHTNVSDEGCAAIGRLQRLRRVHIPWTGVSDRGVEHIAALPQLNDIDLSGAHISDRVLQRFARCPRLESIGLHGAEGISDEGMFNLSVSRSLIDIDVNDIPVTDIGIRRLLRIQTLRKLFMPNTRATDKGILEIAKLRPDIEVYPVVRAEPPSRAESKRR